MVKRILFSQEKLTLDRAEKDFLWNFVKSYAETSEFMMQNGTNFHK